MTVNHVFDEYSVFQMLQISRASTWKGYNAVDPLFRGYLEQSSVKNASQKLNRSRIKDSGPTTVRGSEGASADNSHCWRRKLSEVNLHHWDSTLKLHAFWKRSNSSLHDFCIWTFYTWIRIFLIAFSAWMLPQNLCMSFMKSAESNSI